MDTPCPRQYSGRVTAVRHLAHSWHRLTLALAVCALAVRLIVPAGFMPDAKHFALVLCTGHGPVAATMTMSHDTPSHSDAGDKSDQPCGFGGILVSSLPTTDPVLVLAVTAFIVALVRVPGAALPQRWREWLRPPLRAPPAFNVA